MERLARSKIGVQSREEAIQCVGDLLMKEGYITQGYVDECLAVLHEYGAYFVIAPGIAFVHSKPSASVLKTGLSLVTLQEPVRFGSQDNDPVEIVFMIASTDGKDHLETLMALSKFLADKSNIQRLQTIHSEQELNELIHSFSREV